MYMRPRKLDFAVYVFVRPLPPPQIAAAQHRGRCVRLGGPDEQCVPSLLGCFTPARTAVGRKLVASAFTTWTVGRVAGEGVGRTSSVCPFCWVASPRRALRWDESWSHLHSPHGQWGGWPVRVWAGRAVCAHGAGTLHSAAHCGGTNVGRTPYPP